MDPDVTIQRARALRRKMTLPEVLLWRDLRKLQLERLRFRRQHPVGPYVLDFYSARVMVAIEVDGAAHDHPTRAKRDEERDGWLRRKGVRVLRFPAVEILSDEKRADALATIAAICRAKGT